MEDDKQVDTQINFIDQKMEREVRKLGRYGRLYIFMYIKSIKKRHKQKQEREGGRCGREGDGQTLRTKFFYIPNPSGEKTACSSVTE